MPKTVLLVEDETIVRESLKDWLTDVGYAVAAAEDGEQALEMAKREKFGAMVVDLKLPGKDGIQVIKEARGENPELQAIMITAYPSPETAGEAMKAGAVDYVIKPFSPEKIEKLLEEILIGKPMAPAPVPVKTQEVVRREEVIRSALEQGQAMFHRGAYTDAVKEFEKVLTLSPGHLDARLWLAKSKRAAAGIGGMAGVEEAETPGKAKPCVWMKMGVVRYRLCTNDFNCLTCEFDQQMQSAGESPEIAAALERLKSLPGTMRTCRYALKGEVSARLCSRVFNCVRCEFAQLMEDQTEAKLAKLAVRREALKKKPTRS
ncbi:MAG: response regulator [Chloroflexota bacterium]